MSRGLRDREHPEAAESARLANEVLRKIRIPHEDAAEILTTACAGIAGVLKAYRREIGETAFVELFEQLAAVPLHIKKWKDAEVPA